MLTRHLSLRSICNPKNNWHLLMLKTFVEKGKSMRQPWYLRLVSLLGSCAPRWICSSLQMPHLYWADTMLCIRQRQTAWSTTSCTQHMPHASCTWHFNTFLWNIKLMLGWECTLPYLSVIFKPLVVNVMILSPYCFVFIYFWQRGGSVVSTVGWPQ